MSPTNYTFTKLAKGDAIPFDLLLLADETKEAIEKYIYKSEVYTFGIKDLIDPLGVFVLYRVNARQVEIKNIAVLTELQGKGIGSTLLTQIRKIAISEKYEEIIVGTAETGMNEIRFYEKNGFRKYGIRKNFFIENYSRPIFENGVLLKDMVMLKMLLATQR